MNLPRMNFSDEEKEALRNMTKREREAKRREKMWQYQLTILAVLAVLVLAAWFAHLSGNQWPR